MHNPVWEPKGFFYAISLKEPNEWLYTIPRQGVKTKRLHKIASSAEVSGSKYPLEKSKEDFHQGWFSFETEQKQASSEEQNQKSENFPWGRDVPK